MPIEGDKTTHTQLLNTELHAHSKHKKSQSEVDDGTENRSIEVQQQVVVKTGHIKVKSVEPRVNDYEEKGTGKEIIDVPQVHDTSNEGDRSVTLTEA